MLQTRRGTHCLRLQWPRMLADGPGGGSRRAISKHSNDSSTNRLTPSSLLIAAWSMNQWSLMPHEMEGIHILPRFRTKKQRRQSCGRAVRDYEIQTKISRLLVEQNQNMTKADIEKSAKSRKSFTLKAPNRSLKGAVLEVFQFS